jgi:molecular chaperone GrpE (heat shock protein)
MLYQMRIDSLKDQTRTDLLLAKVRLETLESRATAAERKAAAAEKLAADAHTAAEVLRVKYEAAQDQLLRLDAGQQSLRQRTHDNANKLNAIGLEMAAAKSMTPDPDRPTPVLVVNPKDHPANVTMPRPPEAPGA